MTTADTAPVALITGATGGLGPAVARRFFADGYRLALSARKQEELDTLKEAGHFEDAHVLELPASLTDHDAPEQLVAATLAHYGQLDALVHVAGGFAGGKPVAESDWHTWEFMLNLNLSSAYGMARAVLPSMLERGSGKLVFVSARIGFKPAANLAAYSVSKSGLNALVEVLAAENRAHGINVNAIAPSTIATPANKQSMPNADQSKWVEPESLAGVIAFLCSPAAADIHGAIVPVYGRA